MSCSACLCSRPDLGRSLNTDEAAALGAVYQAAGQTKLFRVKKFIVKDANVLPVSVSGKSRGGESCDVNQLIMCGNTYCVQLCHIQVSFEKRVDADGEGEEVVKVVKKTLFQRGNSYPQKKVLTFNRYSKDFPFSVYYSHLDFLSEQEKTWVHPLTFDLLLYTWTE